MLFEKNIIRLSPGRVMCSIYDIRTKYSLNTNVGNGVYPQRFNSYPIVLIFCTQHDCITILNDWTTETDVTDERVFKEKMGLRLFFNGYPILHPLPE